MRNQNVLKGWLKRKIKYTVAVFVTFMINGVVSFGVDNFEIVKVKQIQGENGVVIDFSKKIGKDAAISIGKGAQASSMNTIAIGENNIAGGMNTITIGSEITTEDKNSIVIGNSINSKKRDTIILGNEIKNIEKEAIVIGNKAGGAGETSA